MIYNVIFRPEGGFESHYCPVCKNEYACPAVYHGGCDDEDWERVCNDCLGIRLGVDFDLHVKIKDVDDRSPITIAGGSE